ncbi:MAG: family 20 glycosylhydrolase [bacterium]|nr:family 20 glycosylhydrolase [bacterium]
MRVKSFTLILIMFIVPLNCTQPGLNRDPVIGPDQGETWRSLHLLDYNNDMELEVLAQDIPELAEKGINLLVLEIDYNFQFQSHPELRRGNDQISKEGARKLASICRENDIRLVIQFQSLGHQSWAKETFPLLTVYPHLDLTPGAFPDNENIYCREWDVTNPEVYTIVFALMDELIDAFETDGIHVGMDEVFLLGHEQSPSTKGKDPAQLYAKAVNDIYDHLVTKRGVEMFMWGDRLIDAAKIDYGEWEASINGTHPAIDNIQKDIIICDWHYEMRETYPSIPMFLDKGFRVISVSWKNTEASQKLINYSMKLKDPQMLGHLFTTWSRIDNFTDYEPMTEGLKILK